MQSLQPVYYILLTPALSMVHTAGHCTFVQTAFLVVHTPDPCTFVLCVLCTLDTCILCIMHYILQLLHSLPYPLLITALSGVHSSPPHSIQCTPMTSALFAKLFYGPYTPVHCTLCVSLFSLWHSVHLVVQTSALCAFCTPYLVLCTHS